MRAAVAALAATLYVAAVACTEAAAPDAGRFTASLRGDTLLLHNGTDAPVHHAVSDVEDPNTILWLLCAGPDCPSLAAGADTTQLLPTVWFDPHAPLFLHWWHAARVGAGGFRPDRLRTIELRR
jgi:hypothetical protein